MKKNHNNKFKTPEGYFDSFNERLMDKIAKEETLIPKSDGFTVPEGYFDELQEKALRKKQDTSKVIALRPYRKFYYVAASVAALLVIALFFNRNKENTINFDDLASAEIKAYFDDTEIGLTPYEIAQTIALEENELMAIRAGVFEENELIDYIDDNMDTFDELELQYELNEDTLDIDAVYHSKANTSDEENKNTTDDIEE